jgi:hypothetical protein
MKLANELKKRDRRRTDIPTSFRAINGYTDGSAWKEDKPEYQRKKSG